jgi:hypothetical protein
MYFRRMENEVEVLSIQRMIDISDGKAVYQVTMAKPHEITEEIRERLSDEQKNSMEIYTNIIQFTVPIQSVNMYPVGSSWKVEINKDGGLKVTPKSKK